MQKKVCATSQIDPKSDLNNYIYAGGNACYLSVFLLMQSLRVFQNSLQEYGKPRAPLQCHDLRVIGNVIRYLQGIPTIPSQGKVTLKMQDKSIILKEAKALHMPEVTSVIRNIEAGSGVNKESLINTLNELCNESVQFYLGKLLEDIRIHFYENRNLLTCREVIDLFRGVVLIPLGIIDKTALGTQEDPLEVIQRLLTYIPLAPEQMTSIHTKKEICSARPAAKGEVQDPSTLSDQGDLLESEETINTTIFRGRHNELFSIPMLIDNFLSPKDDAYEMSYVENESAFVATVRALNKTYSLAPWFAVEIHSDTSGDCLQIPTKIRCTRHKGQDGTVSEEALYQLIGLLIRTGTQSSGHYTVYMPEVQGHLSKVNMNNPKAGIVPVKYSSIIEQEGIRQVIPIYEIDEGPQLQAQEVPVIQVRNKQFSPGMAWARIQREVSELKRSPATTEFRESLVKCCDDFDQYGIRFSGIMSRLEKKKKRLPLCVFKGKILERVRNAADPFSKKDIFSRTKYSLQGKLVVSDALIYQRERDALTCAVLNANDIYTRSIKLMSYIHEDVKDTELQVLVRTHKNHFDKISKALELFQQNVDNFNQDPGLTTEVIREANEALKNLVDVNTSEQGRLFLKHLGFVLSQIDCAPLRQYFREYFLETYVSLADFKDYKPLELSSMLSNVDAIMSKYKDCKFKYSEDSLKTLFQANREQRISLSDRLIIIRTYCKKSLSPEVQGAYYWFAKYLEGFILNQKTINSTPAYFRQQYREGY